MTNRLDAYRLMHEGALALADVERNGFRVNRGYLRKAKKYVQHKIRELRDHMMSSDIYEMQRKRFGTKTNITSPQQLAKVLVEDLGHELPKTANENYKLDETILDSLDLEYTRCLVDYKKYNKVESTYLDNLIKEEVNGFIHAVYNLHFVKTYRSSCDSPNIMNMPGRHDRMAKIIRQAFIPRDGHVLVEIDYSALEFKIASCFYRDKKMMAYASDDTKDIHRDCAAELYKIKKSQVSKQARHAGKNMFVFPELYGDYFKSCAVALWEAAHGIKVNDLSMLDHLSDCGITERGRCDKEDKDPPAPHTFEHHVKETEKLFYKWFPVLKDKKESFWKQYCKDGYFDLMTGFRIGGVWKRNFVLNCIIQGPAFHLLLWSLIQLVKWTRKNKTKTKIVGEIHDSIIADVHESELDDFLAIAQEIMTQKTREHFEWVVVPLAVEAEMSEINWYRKKAIQMPSQ